MLNRYLLDVAVGQINRLLITMPPRHGKSMLTSQYFPAWFLALHPWKEVILASYGADFAASWGRKARDVITRNSVALGVSVSSSSSAADRWHIEGDLGTMQTAGVDGPTTGKGASLLIIDDPVKNQQDASSKTLQDRTWDWYRSVAYTRLTPDGAIVLIQTRWHTEDLAGKIIKEATEPWTVLNLPALAEEDDLLRREPGQALWPEQFSAEKLESIKREIGSAMFAALYQQRPTILGGNLFKVEWFRYFRQMDGTFVWRQPENPAQVGIARADECRYFLIADLATSTKTTADYTVLGVFADDKKGRLFLVDLVRERMETPDIVPSIQRLMQKWPCMWAGIESYGMQLGIVQTARRNGLPVKELREIGPRQDKVTRSTTAQVRMEAGNVFFPEGAKWLADVEDELLHFPNGANDDIADVLAYGCIEQSRLYESRPLVKPTLVYAGFGTGERPKLGAQGASFRG